MAVELRNLLGSGLGLRTGLPATLLFDYPTIDLVVDHLLRDVLEVGKIDASPRDAAARRREDSSCRSRISKSLSDEDAEVLLSRELESPADFRPTETLR